MKDYVLHQCEYISKNQQIFIDQCMEIQTTLKGTDTTESYSTYNIFSITAGSIYFYNLFRELRDIIRTEISNGPLWMQAWVNLHTEDQVLDWHNHYWPYHGYISIDPKDTETEFDLYTIQNKIGQIYFGPGDRLHRVKVISPYQGKRITIGYDVTNDPVMHTGCLGLIPLL
jgi:hypothetical protein